MMLLPYPPPRISALLWNYYFFCAGDSYRPRLPAFPKRNWKMLITKSISPVHNWVTWSCMGNNGVSSYSIPDFIERSWSWMLSEYNFWWTAPHCSTIPRGTIVWNYYWLRIHALRRGSLLVYDEKWMPELGRNSYDMLLFPSSTFSTSPCKE